MTRSRAYAVAALLAVSVIALGLLTGGDGYRIRAEFENAGLLVPGGEVKVAGRTVGTIGDISLAPDGTASVRLDLDDDAVTPLHVGTRAAIRSLGAATITSRYVDLRPGPESATVLPDGAALPTTQTTGIVDLDAILDTFDPATRRSLQQVFARTADLFAGSVAPTFNRMIRRASPAFREVGRLSSELDDDATDLMAALRSATTVSQTIASRRVQLREAISSSSRWTTAVASERESLRRLIGGAPAALRAARETLAEGDSAVRALRPTLARIPRFARELSPFIAAARPALSAAGPVAQDVRRQLPAAKRTLDAIPASSKRLVPAMRAAGDGLAAATPIFRGLRIYGPDFVLGLTNGVAGIASSNYRGTGHYARLSLIQNLQTTPGGLASELLTGRPLVPGVLDVRTGLNARCPGGNAPPAPDGTSPYVPDASLCDPSSSLPASVNSPSRATGTRSRPSRPFRGEPDSARADGRGPRPRVGRAHVLLRRFSDQVLRIFAAGEGGS